MESLYCNTTIPFNLIIVDNCSTDGSEDYLNYLKLAYENLTVHYCETLNSGFAEGINIGLKYAKSSYVVLLNNDILITQKDWLQKLLDCFKEDVAIVTPKLLYPDGRIQYAGATFTPEAMPYHIGRFKQASLYSEQREISTATFACAMIRRELLKDGLDEAFLMGTFEDTDFCVKQRFNGWKILYCPAVSLYHYEGATVLSLPREHYLMQQKENMRLFMERWASWVKEDIKQNPEVYKE